MFATPATEPRTAPLRWVSRVVATLTAVAGIGLVGAGQGFAATTITVDSIYYDTTVSDHQEGVNYTSWGGSGTGGPQIATFTDSAACTGTCQPAADFTARILWGDGTTPSFCTAPFPADCMITPGTQSGNAKSYTVTASHAFVDEKNGVTGTGQGFNVQVIINDVADAGEGPVTASNLGNGGIWVQDQCMNFLNGTCGSTSQPAESFSASAGTQFTGRIATFQDANQLVDPTDTSEYSISINWGDGTAIDTTTGSFGVTPANCGSTPGLATGSGCPVSISGTHTYATAGNRVVKVTVKDGLNPITLTINTTAIVSAAGPACTNAGITSVPNSPQQSGTVITFTGSSSTCGNPEYKFYVQATGGKWFLGHDWGSANYVWNTAGNGATTYNIDVWVREHNSGATYQVYALMGYTLNPPQLCANGAISASPSSPQPSGTTITFTGSATGCSQPMFLFYVQATGGPWILGRTWGFGPYLWKTTGNGKTTYNIDVWIRQNGSKSAHETFAVFNNYRLS